MNYVILHIYIYIGHESAPRPYSVTEAPMVRFTVSVLAMLSFGVRAYGLGLGVFVWILLSWGVGMKAKVSEPGSRMLMSLRLKGFGLQVEGWGSKAKMHRSCEI